jgi:hypothetical protein
VGWQWFHLVRRPLTGLLYQPRIKDDDDECGAVGGMRIVRGNRGNRRKPAPVLFCPPQIKHDLTWAPTRATALGSRRLTAWAMAQPNSSVTCNHVTLCSQSAWQRRQIKCKINRDNYELLIRRVVERKSCRETQTSSEVRLEHNQERTLLIVSNIYPLLTNPATYCLFCLNRVYRLTPINCKAKL